jgi:glycosyltransferase involved in cell wall biosynthesis
MHQTYLGIETIVVDKGSSDETAGIAHDFGVRFYRVDANERSEQKNYGVGMANGKYIYIVDSDFLLEPSVVQEAVDECERGNFAAVCVHNTSDPSVSFWSKVRSLEREMYRDDNLNVAARFVRRDVYEAIGGIDRTLIAAEDYDFQNRLVNAGYRVGRIRAVEVHIGEPRNLAEVAMKHFYYGQTLPVFISKNRKRGLAQLSPARPAFLRHRGDFANNPELTLGFAVYQLVRYESGMLGYAVGVLQRRFRNESSDPVVRR